MSNMDNMPSIQMSKLSTKQLNIMSFIGGSELLK